MRENSEHSRRGKARMGLGVVLLVAVAAAGVVKLTSHESKLDTQVLGASAKKPDTTPPVVTVSFPANDGVYGPAIWTGSVRASASDATGVARVEVQFGSGPWVLASGT